jgi:protein TonB
MPGDLFTHAVAPPPRSKSRWMLAGSLLVHSALIVVLVVVPIVSSVDGPDIVSRLEAFVVDMPVPPTPPAPSPPRTKTTAVASDPNVAPAVSPDRLSPEVVTAPSTPGVPGATTFAGPGHAASHFVQATPRFEAPPPPASPRTPVRPGGAIQIPRRVVHMPPVYPEIARQARIEGTVILEALLDETGSVRDVKVLRSIGMLDRAAIDAVSRWRYTPTRLNGVAVPIVLTVSVTFSLR